MTVLRRKTDEPLKKGFLGIGSCFEPARKGTKTKMCGLCRWGIHKAQVYKDEYVYCEKKLDVT